MQRFSLSICENTMFTYQKRKKKNDKKEKRFQPAQDPRTKMYPKEPLLSPGQLSSGIVSILSIITSAVTLNVTTVKSLAGAKQGGPKYFWSKKKTPKKCLPPEGPHQTMNKKLFHFIIISSSSSNPLTAKVNGAPQMISQPVFSISPCSLLPSGTCWTPGLSIPWCCLPTSSSVCLVFFSLS